MHVHKFNSVVFPGSSFEQVTTPAANVGIVTMSPDLKEGVSHALDIVEQGAHLSHGRREQAGAEHNRAAQYMVAGLYMLAAESARVDTPVDFAKARMSTDPLVLVRNDGSTAGALNTLGLGWATEYASGIEKAAQRDSTDAMLKAGRLLHALQTINKKVGDTPVAVVRDRRYLGTMDGKLTVDTRYQGNLMAEVELGDERYVFASDLPDMWDYKVADMCPTMITVHAFSATHILPGLISRPAQLSAFTLPESI